MNKQAKNFVRVDLIRSRRKKLGLSCEDLASKWSPLAPTAELLRFLEAHPESDMKLSALQRIAEALGLTVGQLIGEVPYQDRSITERGRMELSRLGVRWD